MFFNLIFFFPARLLSGDLMHFLHVGAYCIHVAWLKRTPDNAAW